MNYILKLLPLPANTPYGLTIYCIEIIFDAVKVLKFSILTKIQRKVSIPVGSGRYHDLFIMILSMFLPSDKGNNDTTCSVLNLCCCSR